MPRPSRASTIIEVEQFVVCEALEVAGTLDRLMRIGDRLCIGDLKTGAGAVDYGMAGIAIQLACYAHAETSWLPNVGHITVRPAVDLTRAYVFHLIPGSGHCELVEVDIVAGWEAAHCARWVREWRKRKNLGRQRHRRGGHPRLPPGVAVATCPRPARRGDSRARRHVPHRRPATGVAVVGGSLRRLGRPARRDRGGVRAAVPEDVNQPSNQQEEEHMTTTPDNVWDAFTPPGSGDFPDPHKFDTMGSAIAGTIINIRRAEFDGKAIPELWITTDDGDRSVLCGQANLMAQLLDLRPNVGDRIAIVYTSQRKAKLGMAKLFDVSLKRADGKTFVKSDEHGMTIATVSDPPEVANVKTAADLL